MWFLWVPPVPAETATTAWLIEKLQRPTPDYRAQQDARCAAMRRIPRTHAGQRRELLRELLRLLPARGIHPADRHLYRKDSNISDDVERLRHQATANLLTRRDCVGCAPPSPASTAWARRKNTPVACSSLKVGQEINRDDLLRQFVAMQFKPQRHRLHARHLPRARRYGRNHPRLRGTGRAHRILRRRIDRISTLHPLTGDEDRRGNEVHIFPASHYVAGPERMERALKTIREELDERLAELRKTRQGAGSAAPQHAHHLRSGMLTEVGVCSRRRKLFAPL